MEIMTEYLVLFFLFDCFYLSAMTVDFLLVYVIDLKWMTVVNIVVVNMTVEKFKD